MRAKEIKFKLRSKEEGLDKAAERHEKLVKRSKRDKKTVSGTLRTLIDDHA